MATEERFLNDVKDHVMTIIRDDGVNRHVKFENPDSTDMYFEVITWSGKLCISGDCGTYVFQRIEDMFDFFRNTTAKEYIYINKGYWAEKCISRSTRGDIESFVHDKFKDRIKKYFDEYFRLDDGDHSALWERIEEEVLCYPNDEGLSIGAANAFEDGEFRFVDIWDGSYTDYTFRFIWNCYAIQWAIKKYDEFKTAPALLTDGVLENELSCR